MANIIEGETKVTGDLRLGNVTNPPAVSGGAGAMTTTNKPNASLHLRTDADTLPEVLHNSSVEKLALAGEAVEARLPTLTANGVTTYTTYTPRKGIITAVKRRYTSVPASAAGTVVVGITIDGVQILASANEDEEGLTNDTLTAHNLTATTANLKFESGKKVVITITSNNADMTGGTEGMYYLYYDPN